MDTNFAALITAFGQSTQALVLFVAAAVLAALIVDAILKTSIGLLNRVQRYCRHSLLTNSIVDDFCLSRDREVGRLSAKVEAMQRHEMELANCYTRSRCAAEDVVRAKSLRLLAEIQLLRYEKMPRSWAEKFAAQAAFRRHSN